jgi:hypothetical protein
MPLWKKFYSDLINWMQPLKAGYQYKQQHQQLRKWKLETPSQKRGTSRSRNTKKEPEQANQAELNIGDDTSSEDNLLADAIGSFDTATQEDVGDVIDGAVLEAENVVSINKPRANRGKNDDNEAKSRPPLVGEWQDWLSRTVIRAGTDWYLSHAFAGIDEDLLSDREIEQLKLSKVERDNIAKPVAELANKLKFTRKHGRMIIATTGSFESMLLLGQWVTRVNRISRKYRARIVQSQDEPLVGEVINEHPGSRARSANGNGQQERRFDLFNPGTG